MMKATWLSHRILDTTYTAHSLHEDYLSRLNHSISWDLLLTALPLTS